MQNSVQYKLPIRQNLDLFQTSRFSCAERIINNRWGISADYLLFLMHVRHMRSATFETSLK
jgi:hypothetical protein